jgi:hypothetical protein
MKDTDELRNWVVNQGRLFPQDGGDLVWHFNEYIRIDRRLEATGDLEFAKREARNAPYYRNEKGFWPDWQKTVWDDLNLFNERVLWKSGYAELVIRADVYVIGLEKVGLYCEFDPDFDAAWKRGPSGEVRKPSSMPPNHPLVVFNRQEESIEFKWQWEFDHFSGWYEPRNLAGNFGLIAKRTIPEALTENPSDYVSVIWNKPFEKNEFLILVGDEPPDIWQSMMLRANKRERDQYEETLPDKLLQPSKDKWQGGQGGKAGGVHPELKGLIVDWFRRERRDPYETKAAVYRKFVKKWNDSRDLENEWEETLDRLAIVLVPRGSEEKGQTPPTYKTIEVWLEPKE